MPNRLTKGKALLGAINVPASGLYIANVAVTATAAELNTNASLLATTAELNRVADVSTRIINGTAAGTLSITELAHDGKVVLLNRAAGFTAQLPAATGSGAKLHFVVATTGTANYVITVVGNDTMYGNAFFVTDNAGTVIAFKAGGGSIITLNGSTTAGIKGDSVELIDIAADTWWVDVRAAGTGAEATPFS